MRSLVPMTPYEGVIAENLISIEWELLQHQRMRDASLRNLIRAAISEAAMAKCKDDHEKALDAAFEKHAEDGGDEDDWEEPFSFDAVAAEDAGEDLAARATSRDPVAQAKALAEITALGVAPLNLMGEAYRSRDVSITRHDAKYKELEHRRRDVKRDFDALQKTRPLEAEILEG